MPRPAARVSRAIRRRRSIGRSPSSRSSSRKNKYGRGPELAAVAQAGGDAVDGEVDRAQEALVAAGGAVAAKQFHLQVVQRIEVREAVADRARERRIFGQQLRVPGDGEEPAPRALAFALDALEDARAQPGVGHELG